MLMITSFSNPRVARGVCRLYGDAGHYPDYSAAYTDGCLAGRRKPGWARERRAGAFLENPGDPRYLAASWQSGQTGSGLHYQRFPFLATLRERAGPFTLLLMVACIIVFIIMSVVGDQSVMIALAWPYDPSLQFDVWRYFTHALMHFSVMHILFNLLWWWYLGGAVEKRLGSGKLIVITLISALLSGYVQHKFSGPWFGGLSGVVYALMGYARLRGERDPDSGIYLQRGLITFALIWLIAGWFDLFGMSIANGAHVTGPRRSGWLWRWPIRSMRESEHNSRGIFHETNTTS